MLGKPYFLLGPMGDRCELGPTFYGLGSPGSTVSLLLGAYLSITKKKKTHKLFWARKLKKENEGVRL